MLKGSTTDNFFDSPSQQSQIKQKIVASYFTAWSRIMRNHWAENIPIAYIDLFCGPGVYQDGTSSVPIMLVKNILQDASLSKRMVLAFNDEDENNIASLRVAINQIDGISAIANRIQYSTKIIDVSFSSNISVSANIPVLSFVDPFGYKGLTMDLINTLIKNNGSDCIFFFNYNRINMALSKNTKFDEHLVGIFGEQKTSELKKQLQPLKAFEREPIILNALMDTLKENGANYVLPFKFYCVEMLRTSHFIVFVTKHPKACQIMKQIMYANSAKDSDGVASFDFKDTVNFNLGCEQLSLFVNPLSTLCDALYSANRREIAVKRLCDAVEMDFTNHFVSKNVKDALKRLESQGKMEVVSGRTQKMRNGVLNMPDNAIVRFIH